VASSRRLVKTLRDAVEADRSDAGEFEVRREKEGVVVVGGAIYPTSLF
jgi:hypothetical protein